MTSANVEATSQLVLHCTHHMVIFRNASLEDKYPGGLNAFIGQHGAEGNNHITVHCVTDCVIVDTVRALEALGLDQGKDFVAIDTIECEMWRMIHSDKIDRPFWLETGADWLRYKHWKGRVIVWYDG